jgi:tRNA(adenine34) deaminase
MFAICLAVVHRSDTTIRVALRAERIGNLPIGCIIVHSENVVATGRNSAIVPVFSLMRHAETEALRRLPIELYSKTRKMTCYTTLEPCVMCYAALTMFGVGRIVFGARDFSAGAANLGKHMPAIYHTLNRIPRMEGPVMQNECEELYRRAIKKWKWLRKETRKGHKKVKSMPPH